MQSTEIQKELDKHFDTYRKSSPYDDYMRHYTFRTFLPYIKPDSSALELGCSDGQMTEMISQRVKELDVVEGSEKFMLQAKSKGMKNVTFTHSLFEDYTTSKKYDYVFATYIVTHIPDLERFFKMVRSVLKEDGVLFIAVPNSRVLSRQLALHMGFITGLFDLSQNDINHGHCRAYDRVKLNRDVEQGGFKIIAQGGIIMKPLADFQMDQLIDHGILKKEQMDGLYKLGMEYPDLSGAIYCICKI